MWRALVKAAAHKADEADDPAAGTSM